MESLHSYLGFIIVFTPLLIFTPRILLIVLSVFIAHKFDFMIFEGKKLLPAFNCALVFIFLVIGVGYDVMGAIHYITDIRKRKNKT